MAEVLDQDAETVVLAQIEEPAGVDAAAEIAAVEGIDGLFLGPADLSVGYGHNHQTSDELHKAFETVGAACRAAGGHFMTFVADAGGAKDRAAQYGVQGFMIASEQSWMRSVAKAQADAVHSIQD